MARPHLWVPPREWWRSYVPGVAGAREWVVTRTIGVGGNIYSRPKFTITINSAGIEHIDILNATLNHRLSVFRAFSVGERLTVDSDEYHVTVESYALWNVDFRGQFPLLDPRAGNNVIEYHIWSVVQPSITPVIDWTARWVT